MAPQRFKIRQKLGEIKDFSILFLNQQILVELKALFSLVDLIFGMMYHMKLDV